MPWLTGVLNVLNTSTRHRPRPCSGYKYNYPQQRSSRKFFSNQAGGARGPRSLWSARPAARGAIKKASHHPFLISDSNLTRDSSVSDGHSSHDNSSRNRLATDCVPSPDGETQTHILNGSTRCHRLLESLSARSSAWMDGLLAGSIADWLRSVPSESAERARCAGRSCVPCTSSG